MKQYGKIIRNPARCRCSNQKIFAVFLLIQLFLFLFIADRPGRRDAGRHGRRNADGISGGSARAKTTSRIKYTIQIQGSRSEEFIRGKSSQFFVSHLKLKKQWLYKVLLSFNSNGRGILGSPEYTIMCDFGNKFHWAKLCITDSLCRLKRTVKISSDWQIVYILWM